MSVPPPPTMMWTATATQPPFTVAQWQELEHQALIFKYLKAGLAVPQDLLLPIRKSLQLMSHHPSLGYCASYYGKKIDPEPGRCRRTDGKKWRCSRDAHPDSKYCERHMIRRRYRSRKPVESQSQSQSQPAPPPSHSSSSSSSSSSSQSHFATGTGTASTTTTSASASASAAGTFHTLPLHTNGAREGCSFTLSNKTLPHLQMDPLSFAGEGSKKEYRFGLNSKADEHNFLQKDLGSVRYQGYDFTSDGMWSHMSQIPSNTVSESRSGSTMVSNCFQQQTMRDAELLNLDAARSKELVFSGELSSAGSLKQEYQSPQSLFSGWHWKKDLGSSAIEYKPNKDFNCSPDVNVDCDGSL